MKSALSKQSKSRVRRVAGFTVRPPLLVLLAVSAAALACGQRQSSSPGAADASTDLDGGDGGPESTGAPIIATTTIANAYVKHAYDQKLAVEGGTPPLAWSLSNTPPELAWASLDATTGALSGTPSSVSSGKSLTVVVTDAKSKTGQKAFPLAVLACVDDEVLPCAAGSQGACMLGVEQCTGGQFGACAGGTFSKDPGQCGPSCGACGGSSDRCVDGRCACGDVVGSGPCDQRLPACCSGACVDTQNGDADHCGGCSIACDKTRSNVVRQCQGAVCDYPCQAGFARCPTGSTAPGCDTNLSNDANNCGGCGQVCGDNGNVASTVCQGTKCFVATCVGGYANCDGMFSNGCEVDTNSDMNNCGGCGKQCQAPANGTATCSNGECKKTCPLGTPDLCGDQCVSLLTDATHCGACATSCSALGLGAWCRNGACTLDCPTAGETRCSGSCVNLLGNDDSDCGKCGNRCPTHYHCASGSCALDAGCTSCPTALCCSPNKCVYLSGDHSYECN